MPLTRVKAVPFSEEGRLGVIFLYPSFPHIVFLFQHTENNLLVIKTILESLHLVLL